MRPPCWGEVGVVESRLELHQPWSLGEEPAKSPDSQSGDFVRLQYTLSRMGGVQAFKLKCTVVKHASDWLAA